MKYLFLFFLTSNLIYGYCQNSNLQDSLKKTIHETKVDSVKLAAYYSLSHSFRNSNADSTLFYAEKGLALAKQTKQYEKWVEFLIAKGIAENRLGDLNQALETFNTAQKLAEKHGLKLLEARAFGSIGDALMNFNMLADALSYYQAALDIFVEVDDYSAMANCYGSMGRINMIQGDYRRSLDHLYKGLDAATKLGNPSIIAYSHIYIGNVYSEMQVYDTANYELNLAGEILNKLGDYYTEAFVFHNLAMNLHETGEDREAIVYYEKSIPIFEQVGDLTTLGQVFINIGAAHATLGEYQIAINYFNRAEEIATQMGSISNLKSIYLSKSWVYNEKDDYKNAYDFLSRHLELKDSLDQVAQVELTSELEVKYESEKQELEIANLEKDKKNDRLTIEKEQEQKMYMLIGAALLAVVLLIIFRAYRTKRNDNLLIAKQHEEVIMKNNLIEFARDELEVKNKEILDSITYAKRIQSAILPPKKLVQKYLQKSFILYLPKDIVAGDFYWMESINNTLLFAAADCTGHGVPGAMVSVVCNNALNRSVREYGLSDPGKILDKTREIVIQEFEKSEEDVNDGMDIALCALDFFPIGIDSEEPHTVNLKYAGAHNPLWIIRKDSNEVEMILGNKQPIGKYFNIQPFTTNDIQLFKGDRIYIFSDGYSDQFGGKKGKKMKASNFKKILLDAQHLEMEEQYVAILERFETWRGNFEQLDDVCVIGVQI